MACAKEEEDSMERGMDALYIAHENEETLCATRAEQVEDEQYYGGCSMDDP